MTKYPRLPAFLALSVLLLGLLSACGDEPTPTPAPPTAPPTATGVPATPTIAAGPASPTDITLINDAITKTAEVGSYHFMMDLSVTNLLDAPVTIEGDYQSPDRARMTVKGDGQTQELVLIGNMSYVKQADGSWASSEITAGSMAGSGDDLGLGGLGAMAGGLDPTKTANLFGTLGRFAAGVNSGDLVGGDTMNGVAVRHYKVPLFLGNLMGTGGSTTPGETPLGAVDVWVDPTTQLVHKIDADIDLTDLLRAFSAFAPTPGPGLPSPTPFPQVQIGMGMTLSNFGKVPEISAPAGAKPMTAPVASPTTASIQPAPTQDAGGIVTEDTPRTSATPGTGQITGSGASLMEFSAQAMRDVKSYHFTVSTSTGNEVALTAEGDMIMPSKMSMDMKTTAAGSTTDMKMVKIGDDTWVNIGGQWTKSSTPGSTLNPADFTNINYAAEAELVEDTTLNGDAVHHLRVKADQAGGGSTSELWIDQSSGYLRKVTVETETGGVKSNTTMTYSRFNDATIKIEAPAE